MNTAILYHRVSTLDQDPTLAREALRASAAMRGLAVVEEIEETGSGANNDRPGLQKVMALARASAITHVLVWKLDRFGRSTMDVLTNVEALKRCGVTFVATTQGIEAGPKAGPMGDLVMTLLAAIAQFELNNIRERTLLGLARARAKGRHPGRPKGAKDKKRRHRRWGKKGGQF